MLFPGGETNCFFFFLVLFQAGSVSSGKYSVTSFLTLVCVRACVRVRFVFTVETQAAQALGNAEGVGEGGKI